MYDQPAVRDEIALQLTEFEPVAWNTDVHTHYSQVVEHIHKVFSNNILAKPKVKSKTWYGEQTLAFLDARKAWQKGIYRADDQTLVHGRPKAFYAWKLINTFRTNNIGRPQVPCLNMVLLYVGKGANISQVSQTWQASAKLAHFLLIRLAWWVLL